MDCVAPFSLLTPHVCVSGKREMGLGDVDLFTLRAGHDGSGRN